MVDVSGYEAAVAHDSGSESDAGGREGPTTSEKSSGDNDSNMGEEGNDAQADKRPNKANPQKHNLVERALTESDIKDLNARLEDHLNRVKELSSNDKKIKRRRLNHYKKIGKIKEMLAKGVLSEPKPKPGAVGAKAKKSKETRLRDNAKAKDATKGRTIPRFRDKQVTEAVVLVEGLSYSVDDSMLKKMFSGYEPINKAMIARMKDNKKLSRGFGFVEFPSKEMGEKAAREVNGTEIEGRTVTAKVVPPKTGSKTFKQR